MSAQVRHLRLPGTAALDWLRERSQTALAAWSSEWLSSCDEVTLEVGSALRTSWAPAHNWEMLRGEAGCIWFSAGVPERLKFGRAVVGTELIPSDAVDHWIDAVVDRARDARNRALCRALLGGGDPPQVQSATPAAAPVGSLPPELFAFGSGAVRISCDLLGLYAIADGGVWHSVPPGERPAAAARPGLTPLDRAMRSSHVHLDVVLGCVDLELSQLLDLRPGDALRLPQRLDQGAAVLCDGKLVARATLGDAHGRKAMQLIANTP
jgi:hypothetical protein